VKSLLDLRFVIVSGKGGVGRTTVAAALAQVAATAGKRVLLAGAAAADRIGRIFGRSEPLGTSVIALAPNVDGVNITPESSIREYALMVLHSELVYRAIFENRAVRGFLGAIPGLDAYSILGKAWWHTTETSHGRPRYDLVVFDGPATGHLALMLRIPHAILEAMPTGPLSGDARAMRELLQDASRTALAIVTLAEELPAREAAELAAEARKSLGVALGPLIVNGLPTSELDDPAVGAVLDHGIVGLGNTPLEATLRLAAGVRAHRRAADRVLEKLAADPGLPIVPLPRVPTAETGPALLAALVPHLTTHLHMPPTRP
jgi:anion-transporting  ArsA/GET3 family ATPase